MFFFIPQASFEATTFSATRVQVLSFNVALAAMYNLWVQAIFCLSRRLGQTLTHGAGGAAG